MIGWVLIARETAWSGGAGAPDNWTPHESVRRVLAINPSFDPTYTAPSARYWRLFAEAERRGLTVNERQS